MTRHWYLIDDDGCHRIDVSDDSWDFWSGFRSGAEDEDDQWPAFTQAAVRAQVGDIVEAVHRVAVEFDFECRDVTHLPEMWDGALCFATADGLTLFTEPTADFDERFVTPETAEQIVEELGADGAFFGHDPAAGTLTLTTFEAGAPTLAWSDSLSPGPSHAVTFDTEGKATEEDPRRFALRRLGQPETSPFLDRYAFIEHELAKLGINAVQPDLDDSPIVAVLRLDYASDREHA